MIGRVEACGQVDSASLDCWIQLTLPQVAPWLWVDCSDFTKHGVFLMRSPPSKSPSKEDTPRAHWCQLKVKPCHRLLARLLNLDPP